MTKLKKFLLLSLMLGWPTCSVSQVTVVQTSTIETLLLDLGVEAVELDGCHLSYFVRNQDHDRFIGYSQFFDLSTFSSLEVVEDAVGRSARVQILFNEDYFDGLERWHEFSDWLEGENPWMTFDPIGRFESAEALATYQFELGLRLGNLQKYNYSTSYLINGAYTVIQTEGDEERFPSLALAEAFVRAINEVSAENGC